MSNFNQYDNVVNSGVVFLPGETFSFYANLDTLETDGNFANWDLVILHDTFELAYNNVGTLNQDFIDGYSYRFYSSFTVPADIIQGCYYLAILDDSQNVKYLSNLIRSKSSDYTIKTRYRNEKNILNYNYEGLPSFYNQYYIQLKIRQPTYPTNQIGYDLVSGSFNPVRTVKGKEKEFITLWYNEEDHEAFNAAIIHNDFEIAEGGNWENYKRSESDYQIDWQENYPLAEGSIRLQRKDKYSSSKLI